MTSLEFFQEPVSTLKGVGPQTALKLEKLQITTVGDLLRHFPNRYLDFTVQVKIKDLKEKQASSFLAQIDHFRSFYTQKRRLISQATARDSSGTIKLTWFNNPYIKKLIKEGETYTIAGKPSLFSGSLTIISPVIEEGDSLSLNTKGLVPVYPQTAGISSKWLRKIIYNTLSGQTITDFLPSDTVAPVDLVNLDQAYHHIHFPSASHERYMADKRLAFNEHLRINIVNQLELRKLGDSIKITPQPKIDLETRSRLPFSLTSGQEKAILDIYKDLRKTSFTHRLIQGDTGSGKTATLVFAANQCLHQGYSCAILAPTEILATQHYQTFSKYALNSSQVVLVTGSHKGKINQTLPNIYIGTHALLHELPENLQHPLAFLAIDEQHRFGVKQREELLHRTPIPHLINLSATPIPRTVALGLLGDISLTNITHKPVNRLPTKTYVIDINHYKQSTDWLDKQLAAGTQIFVVCPNIVEHHAEIASVTKIYAEYKKKFGQKYPIWELHGQQKRDDQQRILHEFKSSGRGILVSTSLIEVGIDIPAANIMIIHSAEMFGLAQLHQLRGRVGRGEGQGYCFLVPSTEEETEIERLQLLQKYDSGLLLAQKDLRLRGAGEVFGLKQHGSLRTRLKYFWSKKLFLTAKRQARALVGENPDFALRIATNLSIC